MGTGWLQDGNVKDLVHVATCSCLATLNVNVGKLAR